MISYFGEYRAALLPFASEDQINKAYYRLFALKKGKTIAATENSLAAQSYIPEWDGTQVDTLFAIDEFLTYTDSENHQIDLIKRLCIAAKKRLIVTIRDYKNDVYRGDFDKPYYQIDTEAKELIVNEKTEWNKADKQAWGHTTYVTHCAFDESEVVKTSTTNRRALYFKQLAKFCYDAGCRDFQVVKGDSYKPLFKKHLESVVIVDFNK